MTSLALALLLQAAAPPAPPAGDLPVIVHLADGTSIPLRDWSLSYEYLSWPAGSSQVMGTASRRDTRALWVAKREIETEGRVLELEHRMVPFNPGEGTSGPPEIPVVTRLRLLAPGGDQDDFKPEPPHRDLLLPGVAKSVTVLPRSLDLRGVTLTGTRRELCVVSYTSLVECGVSRDGRVVKLEFPARP